MDYAIIPAVAFCASILTFLSGFGLGTLLTPVFILFFPVDVAIALTAVIHFLNNLFKLGLVGCHANLTTVLRFGVPGLVASFCGAMTLGWLSKSPALLSYTVLGYEHQVLPIKLVIATLIASFTILEMLPRWKYVTFAPKYLPIGGILSGFVGGISGQQGALRSAFLVKLGLSKDVFIGTGVVIACMVDAARLSVYWQQLLRTNVAEHTSLLVAATLAAFAGAYLGNRLLKKVTMKLIQGVVTTLLLLIAIGLGTGLL